MLIAGHLFWSVQNFLTGELRRKKEVSISKASCTTRKDELFVPAQS